jgi:hypothetical protein
VLYEWSVPGGALSKALEGGVTRFELMDPTLDPESAPYLVDRICPYSTRIYPLHHPISASSVRYRTNSLVYIILIP